MFFFPFKYKKQGGVHLELPGIEWFSVVCVGVMVVCKDWAKTSYFCKVYFSFYRQGNRL